MNNLSIKAKILLATLAPITLIAVVLSSVFIMQRFDDIDTKLHNKVDNLADYIAIASEYEVIAQNKRALSRLITINHTDPEILAIEIRTEDGEVLAKSSFQRRMSAPDAFDPANTFTVNKKIHATPINVEDYLTQSGQELPKSGGNIRDIVGRVSVTATTKLTKVQKHDIALQSIFLTLGALILTGIIALLLANSLIGPLNRIATSVDIIKSGNLDHRIEQSSGGELGMLEHNINAMAASLKHARDQERQNANNRLAIEKSKAQTTLEAIGEGVITTDQNGVIVYINPAAERLTGCTRADAAGRHLHSLFDVYNESNNEKVDYPIQSCTEYGHVVRHDALLKLARHDGEEFTIRDTATPIFDDNKNIIGAVVVFDDFTTIQRMAEKLAYQATHDDLTGLYNRREFEAQLDHALQEVHQREAIHSICYIDLDQFKIVNDTSGHVAGDELLRQLTQTLKRRIRSHDVLARLGGDEFGIIFKDCHPEKAHELASMIRDTVQEFQFVWQDRKFQIGASVGMVHLGRDQESISDIMIAADSACYIAKERGRNRIHVYRATDKDQIRRSGEMRWMQRLKHALDADNFELYAQAIHPLKENLKSGRCFELLLRLNEEDRMYTPQSFLNAAERYDLMPDIDKWVIHTTFGFIARNTPTHMHSSPVCFNINLSGQSLNHEDFSSFVSNEFIRHKVDPRRITFEITETAAIANLSRAIAFIKEFKNRGCHFALDDFGSGLSSFGYLTSLPVDYIKIDGKIIRDVVTNPVHLSIVEAINQIAHVMQLKTIAEYVEDTEILEKIKAIHIDYAQGFALATPQPLHDIYFKNLWNEKNAKPAG